MANIGKLNVMLIANSGPFVKGIKRAQKRATRFRNSMHSFGKSVGGIMSSMFKRMAVVGALAGGLLVLGLRKAAVTVDDLAKSSRTLLGGGKGAIATLAGMRLAGKHAGIEIAVVDKSFEKMLETISKANEGDAMAIEALDRVGVSAKELADASPAKRLELIAEGIRNIGDAGDKIAAARGIFGRGGGGMIELFRGGANAIKEATAQAEKFGLVLGDKASANVEKMNDSITDIKEVINGVFIQALGKISPIINEATSAFMDQVDAVGGVGAAVDKAFPFIVSSIGDAIGAAEELYLTWLKTKKLVLWFAMDKSKASAKGQGARDKNGNRTIAQIRQDNIAKRKQEELFGVFPESRRNQARGIAKAGGIVAGDPELEAYKQQKSEIDTIQKSIDDIEKRKGTKESTRAKFEAFVYKAAEKNADAKTNQLSIEEDITDEMERQRDLQKAMSTSGNLKLMGLGGGGVRRGGQAQIQGIQVGKGRDFSTGAAARFSSQVAGNQQLYVQQSVALLGQIAGSVKGGQVAVAG